MAKRLRGWQLEMESGRSQQARPSKALEKGRRECRGTLSATLIRELADCAIQDGAQHRDLASIAQTGNWGAKPGNVHKQIVGHFCSNVLIAEPHDVQVPCTHPKTSKDALEGIFFLPHMMFSKLGHNYPTFFLSAVQLWTRQAERVLEGIAKTGDDKLIGHPMTLEKGWEDLNIPLFVHGDGVEYANIDNLMVFSWGSLLSSLTTLLSHWLLACCPKSCGKKETWEVIWKHLQWSFQALASGRRPTTCPNGKPLEKGSAFYPYRGQLLHPKGFKGVLWSVIGDHEFFSNTLGQPLAMLGV